MSLLSGLKEVLAGGSGSFFSELRETVQAYFPPDMSPEKKAELEYRLRELQIRQQSEMDSAMSSAEAQLTERTALLEGTASDLRSISFVGPLVLFLRGLQRIAWSYATMYLDVVWFMTPSTMSDRQEAALMIINLLVLGFLFGERAVQNVAPILTELFIRRKQALEVTPSSK